MDFNFLMCMPYIPIVTMFVVNILMGVWVYKDASSRDMNGLLWCLVTIVVPNFLGLLVYLIVRGKENRYRCEKCSKLLEEDSMYCKYCGTMIDYKNSEAITFKKNNKILIAILTIIIIVSLFFASIFIIQMKSMKSTINGERLFNSEPKIENKIVEKDGYGLKYYISFENCSKKKKKTIEIDSNTEYIDCNLNLKEGKGKVTISDDNGNKLKTINSKGYKKIPIEKGTNKIVVEVKLKKATGAFIIS